MIEQAIQSINQLIRAELIFATVLLGLAVIMAILFGIFWAFVKLEELTQEKEDDPMDMFMGGRKNPPI